MVEIYVFGYSGFVGSHFVEQLVASPQFKDEVQLFLISRGEVKVVPSYMKPYQSRITFITSKIEDIESELFSSKHHKFVYYFAAEVDFYAKAEIIGKNLEPFRHILEILPQQEFNQITYVSTLGVFDRNQRIRECDPLNESSPHFPSSYYGIGKLQCEQILKKSGHFYRIVRLPWCYGSRMSNSHHLISLQDRMKSVNPIYFFNWPGRISVLSVESIYSRISVFVESTSVGAVINLSDSYAPSFGELFQVLGRGTHKLRGGIAIPIMCIKILELLVPFLPFTARCLFQDALYSDSELNNRLFGGMGNFKSFDIENLRERAT